MTRLRPIRNRISYIGNVKLKIHVDYTYRVFEEVHVQA